MKVKLEDDGEDNSELIEEIEDSSIEEYIHLPGQYEINEYRIMEEFIQCLLIKLLPAQNQQIDVLIVPAAIKM